jgi:hypothetical protein
MPLTNPFNMGALVISILSMVFAVIGGFLLIQGFYVQSADWTGGFAWQIPSSILFFVQANWLYQLSKRVTTL